MLTGLFRQAMRLFLIILNLFLLTTLGFAQAATSFIKNVEVLPAGSDTSGNYCFCKLVTFSSGGREVRTDAIMMNGSQPSETRHIQKSIEAELSQALVFFDSYRVLGNYYSATDCSSMYKFLIHRQPGYIHQHTILLSSYASRF